LIFVSSVVKSSGYTVPTGTCYNVSFLLEEFVISNAGMSDSSGIFLFKKYYAKLLLVPNLSTGPLFVMQLSELHLQQTVRGPTEVRKS
jgi:hypothetical protein